MAKNKGNPINYQGYEVVFSYSADCPVEVKKNGSKFCPVYDDLRSLTAALQKLQTLRRELSESTHFKNYYEYSSYILKINPHKYELHFKSYIML